MYPAYGLMETSERYENEKESCSPVVVTELNAVEEHSSSDSNDSEATIPAVPAMHAMARAGVCPNFSPGDPFIIIEKSEENSCEKYPVMSSTVAGEPVCWERSAQDATVKTSVADSERNIRTGQWENSRENSVDLCVETSRGRSSDCCATSSCTISEDSGMLPLGPAVEAVGRYDTMEGGVGCSDGGSSVHLAVEMSTRPLPIGGDTGECPDGASVTNSTVTTTDGECGELEFEECDDEVQNFGRLFESTTIVAEPEARQNGCHYPEPSQTVSFTRSSAAEAYRRQRELEKIESEAEEMNIGDRYSPTDDSSEDSARRDQPAPAVTTTPQPIMNKEIMKSTEFKEFEDIQSGNNKENYESFVLPSCDAEFAEYQGEAGLEETRLNVRSEERSGETSKETSEKYGDWRSGDIGEFAGVHREEVLYNPIQTAPLQTEIQSSQRCGRPARSSVRPSRFRDEAFETEFQPRRKKKLRRVCLHPGRGESSEVSSVDEDCDLAQKPQKEQTYFRFGRGDPETMKQGVPKQVGHTRSSLAWPLARALFQGHRTTSCKDRCCRGRSTEVSRQIGLKFSGPIWSNNRFKKCKWRIKENRGEKKRIALNHQYQYRIENLDTRSTEFRRDMCSMQLKWPHYRCMNGKDGDGRSAKHSVSFGPASSYRLRTMVCRLLIRMNCYVSGRCPKMNRPSLLRHESETEFISRKLNHGKFRLTRMSRPTRFRPRKCVNGRRKLRQRQPGFSILSRRLLRFRICNRERKEKCKLDHSYRLNSENSDIRILRPWLSLPAIINSDTVIDCTGNLQATIDEINSGDSVSRVQSQCSLRDNSSLSPNCEFEKGELEELAKRKEGVMNKQLNVTKLCQHLRNNSKQAITQQLLSTESLTGAQRLQYQMQSSSVEERRMCAMNNNVIQSPQSSALTAHAIDRGVKLPSPAKVSDCLMVCRCEEVIKRCDSDQSPTRRTSCKEQCSNVRRLRLYPCRQCIQWQLSPISEQIGEKCSDNTTSMKVSQLKTGIVTPLSSSEIFSDCLTESRDVAEMEQDVPVCVRRAEQSQITSEFSTVPCILQSLGDFPETLRKSKVKNDEGACEKTGVCKPTVSSIQREGLKSSLVENGCSRSIKDNERVGTNAQIVPEVRNPYNGVSRPLYGRLQKNKRGYISTTSARKRRMKPIRRNTVAKYV